MFVAKCENDVLSRLKKVLLTKVTDCKTRKRINEKFENIQEMNNELEAARSISFVIASKPIHKYTDE